MQSAIREMPSYRCPYCRSRQRPEQRLVRHFGANVVATALVWLVRLLLGLPGFVLIAIGIVSLTSNRDLDAPPPALLCFLPGLFLVALAFAINLFIQWKCRWFGTFCPDCSMRLD